MLADLARASVGSLQFYRSALLPALDPIQVRILRTEQHPSGWTVVVVTTKLGLDEVVSVGETFEASPDELHFNLTAFEDFDEAHATDPAPPPSFSSRKTDPCPPSDPVSDRMVSISILAPKR